MLLRKATFDEVYRDFAWDIPEVYNVGHDVCDRWAEEEPGRVAVIDAGGGGDGAAREFTYGELRGLSNQLANALHGMGVSNEGDGTADRVGVLLPQRAETAVAHIAVTKMGCISIPLFTLFGEEALLYRLADSGARAVVTDREGCAKLARIRDKLPGPVEVLSVDGEGDGVRCFHAECAGQSADYRVRETGADDPAFLIYTSGTTGNPKGALHAHRVLLGHLPGVEVSHNFLPGEGDRLWTPADWAWIGGLLDVLMPALHHGITVVARRFPGFDARAAFDLIREHGVRNTFLPPTAIKMMRLLPEAADIAVPMRSVASGGESLGSELLEWGREVFGTTINEFYGQTECNMVVSSCAGLEPPVPGSMGREVPGHTVRIVDPASGAVLPDGKEGAIAVKAPDPVMFLGYWNDAEATAEKFVDGPEGRWLLTGDRGSRDAEGRFHFLGRDDDVIGSAGYRIGPGEVENCLLGHEAVELAGVVGKPDGLRGSVVAAYVVLGEGFSPSDGLAEEIGDFVKRRLSAHEYPRVVRFIDEMPMTTTGKIIRGDLRRMAEREAMDEQGPESVGRNRGSRR